MLSYNFYSFSNIKPRNFHWFKKNISLKTVKQEQNVDKKYNISMKHTLFLLKLNQK